MEGLLMIWKHLEEFSNWNFTLSVWRILKWECLCPGMIVWRYASFPKRPRINLANTATLRESWISNTYPDNHTCSRRAVTMQPCAFLHTHTHNDSVMRHFAQQNHSGSLLMYSNLLFTSHPRKTYWAFPFPYSSSTHTHTRQHRKRGIASVNHVHSTPRVTVYTNNVRPPTHTDPAMGESRRKTQEDTLSMADMEREQSLICNH